MKNQSLDAIIKRDDKRDKKLGKTGSNGYSRRGGALPGRGRGGANQNNQNVPR